MCDFGHDTSEQKDFGFLVDVPEIRSLIFETRRLTEEIDDAKIRVEALRPAFAKLLASDGWLPKEYGEPDRRGRHAQVVAAGQYGASAAQDPGRVHAPQGGR